MTKQRNKRPLNWKQLLLLVLLLIGTAVYNYYFGSGQVISLEDIPEYTGQAYVAINGNEPFFTR